MGFMERFWSKVDKNGPIIIDTPCWIWTSYTTGEKRAAFSYKGKNVRASRFAWELTYGSIPKGLLACHKCDNSLCVNPNHLFLGTHKDNTWDMINKGRSRLHKFPPGFAKRGEEANCVILKKEQVDFIKKLYASGKYSQRDLAFLFKTVQQNIWAIVNNKTWK
jgi:hypothetical protein